MIFLYAVSSSVLITTLHKNYNSAVNVSAETAANTMKDILRSVVDTSISIIGNVKVREYLVSDDSETDFFNLYLSAKNAIDSSCINNTYISHIQVASTDGSRVLTTDNKFTYTFSEEEKERMRDSNGAWFWSLEDSGKVSVCRLMRNTNRLTDKIGYIKIVLDDENIKRQLYLNSDQNEYSYALMDDKTGTVVLDADGSLREVLPDIFAKNRNQINKSSGFVMQEGKKYLVFSALDTKSLVLVTAARDQGLYFGMMKYGIIFLFVLLFGLAAALYTVMYRKNIVVPLTTLSSHMKGLKPDSGALSPVQVEAKGEVKELVDSFNAMAGQLTYLYETNYKNELKLRDANLLILNSEINPHFLYNVLDSIRWMMEMDQKEAAAGMIQRLSEMFRLSLELSENSVISLHKEVEHLKKYVEIEKYRFQDKVHFQMNIQKNMGNPQVIKFILQPLVENALVHGISRARGYGNVLVSVYISEENLIYDVRDDGCGADPERIRHILDRTLVKQNSLEGFALENIQARLKLGYGEKYGIEFQPRDGGGSIFIVKQPLRQEQEGWEYAETDNR